MMIDSGEKMFEPQKGYIAGFDIYGERQPDGTIVIGCLKNKVVLPDFPEKIKLLGVVYELDCIKKQSEEINLKPGMPGFSVEWEMYL